MSEHVNINAYIELYNSGVPISRMKAISDQTFKVFSMSPKANIRIVSRKSVYKNPLAFSKIKKLIENNEYFYMAPMTTVKETIVGFIIRGILNKSYSTVTREFSSLENKVPVMYGFNTFKSYDKKKVCYPIIVCEGCKDCLTLKRVYPYVLANNTSSMGMNSEVLRNISDKFLLAYDNDEAGKDGMEKDKRILSQTGARVDIIKISDEYKDCTDCAVNEDGTLNERGFKFLKEQVLRKLKWLYNGV